MDNLRPAGIGKCKNPIAEEGVSAVPLDGSRQMGRCANALGRPRVTVKDYLIQRAPPAERAPPRREDATSERRQRAKRRVPNLKVKVARKQARTPRSRCILLEARSPQRGQRGGPGTRMKRRYVPGPAGKTARSVSGDARADRRCRAERPPLANERPVRVEQVAPQHARRAAQYPCGHQACAKLREDANRL